MDGQQNSTHIRDVSFSSYLSTAEEIFVHKLADSVQKPKSAISSSQEKLAARSLERRSLERARTEEAEISVFGAEKYFDVKLDDESPAQNYTPGRKHDHKKENRVDIHQTRARSRPGTPSVSSVSSWNSQTALLRNSMRNQSPGKQKKANGRSFLTSLSCNGSCSDDKSVFTNQNVEHRSVHRKEYRKDSVQFARSPVILDGRKQFKPRLQTKNEANLPGLGKVSIGSNKEEYFALQIKKSDANHMVKRVSGKQKIKEKQWKSAEMLGSNGMSKGDIAMNLERKLSMLTWDAIPNAPNLPITSMSNQTCEDMESDASSDLFEIANISGTDPPSFTRQASDGMSRYEPSEASIEWSVVTGSAADFSAVSNSGEKNISETIKTPSAKTKSTVQKEVQSSLSSRFLGCKSQNAVRVAETAHRSSQTAKPQQLQPQKPFTSIQ